MVPPLLSCPLPPRASSHDPARAKVSAVRHPASFQFGHYSRFARAPCPAIAADLAFPHPRARSGSQVRCAAG